MSQLKMLDPRTHTVGIYSGTEALKIRIVERCMERFRNCQAYWDPAGVC